MDPFYGGMIWTNHALARAKERGLTQDEVVQTIRNSSTSQGGNSNGSTKYIRLSEDKMIEVIVKRNEKNQVVILSCWSKDKSKFKLKIPIWETVLRWLIRLVFSKK